MTNPVPIALIFTGSVFAISQLFGGTSNIQTKLDNSKYQAERAYIESVEREAARKSFEWYEIKDYECVSVGRNVRAEVASYYAMPSAWLVDAYEFEGDYTLKYDVGSTFKAKTYTTSAKMCLDIVRSR